MKVYRLQVVVFLLQIVKGTGSNGADVRILATGTGNAYLWLDASNGDLSGADYAFVELDNTTLDLEIVNYANDVIIKNRNGTKGQVRTQYSYTLS